MSSVGVTLSLENSMVLCEHFLKAQTREMAEQRLAADDSDFEQREASERLLTQSHGLYVEWDIVTKMSKELDKDAAQRLQKRFLYAKSLYSCYPPTNRDFLECLWDAIADYVVRKCEERDAQVAGAEDHKP